MKSSLLVFYAIYLCAFSVKGQNFLSASGSQQYLKIDTRVNDYFADAEGSPYLSDWAAGVINFVNNSRLEEVPMRYNVYNNTIEVTMENKIYAVDSEYVTDFTYLDPVTKENKAFKRVWLSKQNNSFLHLILEDKITLGAHYSVRLVKGTRQETGYEAISHAKDKLNLITVYYLINKSGWPLKLPRTKKSLLKKLPSHSVEIAEYLDKNKLDVKKDEDLIKAMAYYNQIK